MRTQRMAMMPRTTLVAAALVVLVDLSPSTAAAFLLPSSFSHSLYCRHNPIYYSSTNLSAKRGKGGKGGGGGTKTKQPPGRIVPAVEFVDCQPDGSDAWRCLDVVDILRRGGVGVLPTETGYGLVTLLESREGLERILRMKGQEHCKKPLSLLCADLKTVDKYCYGINQRVFKKLKKNLPGPYTFILPASTALPKMIFLDSKGSRHAWARKTLGVRMCSDPVLRYVQDELLEGEALLVSSLPREEDEDEDEDDGMSSVLRCRIVDTMDGTSWCENVDFVVDAGERPLDGSTIFDLTGGDEAVLVREGLGDLELA